ncbi:hypothetical protein HKCCE3408_07020 [Rhodobacterales bacterium HKCCE3408]|nr:hypothetical protein [Rhodobacterales bacterium HKCCE3408]
MTTPRPKTLTEVETDDALPAEEAGTHTEVRRLKTKPRPRAVLPPEPEDGPEDPFNDMPV